MGNAAGKGQKRYKAGIYARLSADIDEKKESIDVQIGIAEKFVEEFNRNNKEKIDIVGHYCDIGKTGSNFNRDSFNRLMQDIRLGDIDCVIVKDLSRFGRNYLEAGNYIEKIFPFLGVRFIAVSDGYDTGEEGNDTRQMASEIKNLVNDMYAKDFSMKAKTGLRQRREAGSYVGGPPPYGYLAVWEGRVRKLVPDENTAGIVELIYRAFIEKESYAAVADDLNRKRINPPTVYKRTKEVYCPLDVAYKGWDKSSVERIIRRETYIGKLVQGKTTLTARDEKSRIHKSAEEWVIKDNMHEALINTDLFQRAQEVRRRLQEATASNSHPTQGVPIGENVFDHVLYCGVCGRKMTRHSYVKTYADGERARLDGYFCLNGGRTKVETCPQSNRISRNDLTGTLMNVLHMEFATYLDKPMHYIKVGKDQINAARFQTEKEIKTIQKKAQRLKEEETGIYMDYREGRLPQKEYVDFKMKQAEYLYELEKRAGILNKKQKEIEKVQEKYLKAIRSLLKMKNGESLTMELVDALVEKIYVYPGKRVEVQFRYVNEMLEGVIG
ncbi:MAG: recombinase family protein [Lachnospiraceae bacterium]|nr:recombinase family protein [Lachnospiraceae bacterium]